MANMTVATAGQPAPHTMFNHPQRYTAGEGCSQDDTLRDHAAWRVRNLVQWIETRKSNVPISDAGVLFTQVRSMFKDPDDGAANTWNMSLDELRYVARLLEYHVAIEFDYNKQDREGMGTQVVKAVANAVSCTNGGRLRDVIRPWNITWGDIEWDIEGTMWRWLQPQVQHCFQVVWYFNFLNVKADRICHDVFQYKGYLDIRGLALFSGCNRVKRRDLGLCMRDVYIDFSRSAQKLQEKHLFAALVKQRRISIGGEGVGGGGDSQYVFASQMWKHLPDLRVYDDDATALMKLCTAYAKEAIYCAVPSELHVPKQVFLGIASSVNEMLTESYKVLRDLGLKSKSAFVDEVDSKFGAKFVEEVIACAPERLQIADRQGKRFVSGATTQKDVHRRFKAVIRSVWNTRSKMIRKNDVSSQKEQLTQVGGFRQGVAGKQVSSTEDQVKCFIKQ